MQEIGGVSMSPISKAQQKAVHKYVKENYDRLNISVPKGEKEEIQTHAQQRGESLNGFVTRAIHETMGRDTQQEGGA
jgi:predicted HicB family RNase H-like nuclease